MSFFEYSLISDFYKGKFAKGSGMPYINHINEGISILEKIGASQEAARAFCIHPLFQEDTQFINSYNSKLYEQLEPKILYLVLEYRSVANEYLSKRKISSLDEVRLSPLKDVSDMLIADKIQNYKDFLLYNKNKHPRSKELDDYFNNWINKLDCRKIFEEVVQNKDEIFSFNC